VDKRPAGSIAFLYAIVFIAALAVFGVGVYLAVLSSQWAMLAAGSVCLVVVMSAWILSTILSASSPSDTARELVDALTPLNDRLREIQALLTRIGENQLISDRAKAVAFRTNDRDALRRAIREDIDSQDWDAAFVLVTEMERQFGYKQEADRLREEITQKRDQVVRRQIGESVAVIDRYTRAEQWSAALHEAERLMQVFPDNDLVRNLPNEIDSKRQALRKQLLDRFHDARAKNDVDGAIDLLRQLDLYLTPVEAESLQEAARGVFKAKLDQLKNQFSTAVQDRDWHKAVETGDQIINEYPNTRVAQEVREKMDTLRQRAAEPTETAPT